MTANRLAEWLNQFPHINNTAEPVRVTIRGTVYPAARYMETRTHDGKPYTREAVYVLGDLPASYRRSSHTAFPCNNTDWFVAAHWPAVAQGTRIQPQNATSPLNAEGKPYHPFGHMFILCPWDTRDGSSIDCYSRHPYARFPMTIETND